ncbi:MAG: LptA/OstA family protein [Brevundimonas sp.]|uniref:LptA/OstA family protein n=1 Tax=Brevundimonas sp. TaxID=1871086 RepID=UPI0040332172
MKRSVVAAAAALSLLAVVGGATAQSRANVSRQPIQVGANTGEYTPTGFSLRDQVEITQGPNRLRADAIEGARGSGDQINTVTASGGVYYVTPNETIRGDRAVYTVSNATIVVTGDVILTQGKNVLTGSRLTYNVDTGAASMASSAGSRIQGVFYPQGSGG